MSTPRPPRLHNEVYPFLHPEKYRDTLVAQVVVITGAAGALGQGLSKCFAIAGSVLHLLDVTTHPLDELKNACLKIGARRVFTGRLDVTSHDDCKSTVDKIVANSGPVDILVNCAGIGVMSFFHSQPISQFKKVMDVNLYGPCYLMHLVLPSFFERKRGCIINIASRAGTVVSPMMTSYNVSKAALIHLTSILQAECDMYGDLMKDVHLYALHPGGIVSNISQSGTHDELIDRDFPWVFGKQKEWLAKFKTSPYLPGMVAVALANGVAKDVLRGRYFDCEQDLEDVLDQKQTIAADDELYRLHMSFVGGLRNDGGTEDMEGEDKASLPEGF